MASTSKDSNVPLLPLLYVLLAIDGILTILLAAGIVWFSLHPAEKIEAGAATNTAVEREQQSPYGPRTMISTYSIRAEERGWNTADYDVGPSEAPSATTSEEQLTPPAQEPIDSYRAVQSEPQEAQS